MDNTQIATLTLAVTALIALANLITAVAAARNARINVLAAWRFLEGNGARADGEAVIEDVHEMQREMALKVVEAVAVMAKGTANDPVLIAMERAHDVLEHQPPPDVPDAEPGAGRDRGSCSYWPLSGLSSMAWMSGGRR